MALSTQNKFKTDIFMTGDLVEFMRDIRPDRPKFGIVLNIKKLARGFSLEVLWGDTCGYIDSKLVKKR